MEKLITPLPQQTAFPTPETNLARILNAVVPYYRVNEVHASVGKTNKYELLL